MRLLLSQTGWGRLLLTLRFIPWLLVTWRLAFASVGLIAFLSFVLVLLTLGLILLTLLVVGLRLPGSGLGLLFALLAALFRVFLLLLPLVFGLLLFEVFQGKLKVVLGVLCRTGRP